ncbi:MAG: sulfotransferase domain-containing protein, partial [Candidatus Dadabacteria bacterium]|nr:sulfotransferase domain-containing protein [Candidatus Dadabacteria bacterium]
GSGTRFITSAIEKLFLKEGGFEQDRTLPSPHHQTHMISKAVEAGFKVIHVVRDGRSQIQSRILDNHGIDGDIIKKFNIKVSDEKYLNYAVLWKWFIEEGIKGRGHENYLEIKYEDFLERPSELLKLLSEFCELKAQDNEIENVSEQANKSRAYAYLNDPRLKAYSIEIADRLDAYGY